MKKTYTYRVVLDPAEEGGYTVWVPDLPGAVSEGDTREEAISNIKEAIHAVIESLVEDGKPVPAPTRIFEEVQVSA